MVNQCEHTSEKGDGLCAPFGARIKKDVALFLPPLIARWAAI